MDGAQTRGWLALMIGNSHLHWGWFENATLQQSWDTPHLSAEEVDCLIRHQFDFSRCVSVNAAIDRPFPAAMPLWVASVVPSQTQLWQSYADTHRLSLDQIPLAGMYPTMGIDRALALWGAANVLGLPALVIDAGTALTLTAADAKGQWVGGAILPGLGLQIQSLTEHTAALPSLSDRLNELRSIGTTPPRWATNTPDAMISGVLYTLLAGIDQFTQTWLQDYPNSPIVLTGGDGDLLFRHWQNQQNQYPERAWKISIDSNLVFWGMRSVVDQQTYRKTT